MGLNCCNNCKDYLDAWREGFERGFIQGWREGWQTAKIEIAKRLKESEILHVTQIITITGLTKEEIEKL